MIADRFDALLRRMERSKVARRKDLVGCSDAEISALETRYGVRLPQSYWTYLSIMGHASGRLFTHDHLAVQYKHIIATTDTFRQERLGVGGAREEPSPPPEFSFPDNALIIASRLSAAWEFILCDGGEDTPVWFFEESRWTIQRNNKSVLDWLEAWCGEAESAIKSGYFKRHPDGTTP